MRRLILIWSLLGSLTGLHAQTISRFEYFFDSDPGFGLANILLPTNPGGQIEEDFIIPTDSLDPGFHVLYMRAYNPDSMAWSFTTKKAVYLFPAPSDGGIQTMEYFVDQDPGFGNGSPIPITSGDSFPQIEHILPLSQLTPGGHVLYLRCQNERGEWSFIQKRGFCVAPDGGLDDLVRVEYQFSKGLDFSQVFTYTFPQPMSLIELSFEADNTFLQSLGDYSICAQVFTNAGKFSTKRCDAFSLTNTTTLEPEISRQAFRLFPNPSSGKCRIQFDKKPVPGTSLSVLTPDGKRIQRFDIQEATFDIHLPDVSAGVYMVIIQAGSSVIAQPLLIQP